MSGKGILGDLLPGGGGLLGGLLGSLIAPGIGTAIGAGLGDFGGGLASGEKPGQAAIGGLEAGALSGLASALAPAAGSLFSGGASAGTDTAGLPAVGGGGAPGTTLVSTPTDFAGGVTSVGGLPAAAGAGGAVAGGGGAPAAPGGTADFSGLAAGTGGGAAPNLTASLGGTSIPSTGTLTGVSVPGSTNVSAGDLGNITGASSALPVGQLGPATVSGASGAPLFFGATSLDNSAAAALPTSTVSGLPDVSTGLGTPSADALLSASPTAGGTATNFATPGVGTGMTTTPDWLSNAASFVKGNPGLLLGGGVLGAEALMGNKPLPQQGNLTTAAGNLANTAGGLTAQANQNLNAVNTGALPAGAESAIDQAAASAKAATLSKFASLGLGNSTMAAEAVGNIDQQTAAQKFEIANQLVNTGVSEAGLATSATGLETNIYSNLMNAQIQQDQNLQRALAAFAGSLAGPLRPATAPAPAA